MALELTNGTVFLHIPKTGGSLVTEALVSAGLVDRTVGHIHADVDRYRTDRAPVSVLRRTGRARLGHRLPAGARRPLLQAWTRVTSRSASRGREPLGLFCFVRHPLDWYGSWWRYMYERAGADWSGESDLCAWHPCAPLRDLGDRRYAGFIDNVIDREPGFVTGLFGRYLSADTVFVGRQERLVDDLGGFARRTGLDIDDRRLRRPGRVNATSIEADPISEATRRELARLEYPAMRRFGYEDRRGR